MHTTHSTTNRFPVARQARAEDCELKTRKFLMRLPVGILHADGSGAAFSKKAIAAVVWASRQSRQTPGVTAQFLREKD